MQPETMHYVQTFYQNYKQFTAAPKHVSFCPEFWSVTNTNSDYDGKKKIFTSRYFHSAIESFVLAGFGFSFPDFIS